MTGVTTRNAAPTRRQPLAVRNPNYGSHQKEVERQRTRILAAAATRIKENIPNKDGTINKDALIATANGGLLQEDSSDDKKEEEQISMNNDQVQAQEGTTVEGSGNLLEQTTIQKKMEPM